MPPVALGLASPRDDAAHAAADRIARDPAFLRVGTADVETRSATFHKGVRQAALVKAEEFPRVAGVIRSFIGIDEKAAKEGEAFMAPKQH